ncbi:hypothetical protein N6H14_28620 [Paenibacillus sp. CC-CFT747]|nr:hypothetical protein N6H14_28620 [Paenibacillus sp. CC-CFT747]
MKLSATKVRYWSVLGLLAVMTVVWTVREGTAAGQTVNGRPGAVDVEKLPETYGAYYSQRSLHGNRRAVPKGKILN